MRMNKNMYTVAVAQINTGNQKKENLKKIEQMVQTAVAKGARLVCFPEMVNIQSEHLSHMERAEEIPGKTSGFLSNLAREHHVWICGGTILEIVPGEEKVFNTSLLFDCNGTLAAKYRKRHTFDITMEDGREFRESNTVKAGEEIVLAETEIGKLGFGICYDLRFPEQYREMTKHGMEVLLLPASFTKETGEAHWETLLRARAIENGCYVLASNQCGQKVGYEAFGHSMIVDPWGRVLAKASDEETILYAQVDLSYVEQVRKLIPSTIMK